jgi:isopentenyl diphosphate isomerase/L-lactate dehydrogenase-like FMN-dependent dehydrogenase
MFVTGASTVSELKAVRKIITPPLTYWVD